MTSAERARDCKHPLVLIRGVVGRCNKPRLDMHYQHGPISTVAGYYARQILWPNAGVGPEDIDITGSYDAFTFTTMLQLEDYGFCKKGEGGEYVSSGAIQLGGRRPNNTSGGHLCEGYTHGMNMVIENTRQLRHDADDSCPIGADGKRQHTYDYREGGCRQVQECRGQRQSRLGQSVDRLVDGHAARLRGRQMHGYSRRISGHGADRRRSRYREPRIFPPLRGARFPSAGLRAMRPAALPADHRLPVVRDARNRPGGRSRARARCTPTARCTTRSSRPFAGTRLI